jgi:8-oxo-dGTP pyrophosphatase MutT (NUDIX family)
MTWKPHATVAAIIERDNRFLMVEEMIDGERVINQPAGHLEPDESIIEATIRETFEETAWRFQPEAITGIYLWKHPVNEKTFLRIALCGQCHDHDPDQVLDEGIIQATWKTRDELTGPDCQLRSPMVLTCIDDYLSGRRLPLDALIDVA